MKTVTLRELRNEFSKLEAWLEEGEQIQIERRGQPIALLTGLNGKKPGRVVMPDFLARSREIWGDRVFTAAEVEAMRQYEQDHEGV